jgi:Rps23 Pro-64 3,4-dihydroxylase Tpa1-like proline 4-hydroxylase
LPDPHLLGAGVHLVKRGGVLQIHSDFNWAEHLEAHRRVNMFIYFNPGWQEGWGGALELWNAACKEKVCEYAPLFNRMVVFNSRSDTFHGHPHPLECPENIFRKSIAMYYYTAKRPEVEIRDPHNTLYKGYHFNP